MRALNRKLLRDLRELAGQMLAIGAVMATGIAMLVTYSSTFASLDETQRSYYERYGLGDVFASAQRAPRSIADRLRALPGVEAVEVRTVVDVVLDLEDLDEPATGRLVSIPEDGQPALNRLVLRQGRWLNPDKADEVLVHEAFAESHHFEPGDHLAAVINGRRRELEIVGIALSPEYVYVLGPGALLPDDLRFGVLWMGRRSLATAFDMEGGFNDAVLALSPGVSTASVIEDVDRLLEPYGGLGAIPRELQSSAWFVANELKELRSVGTVMPLVFLFVAAFLLNIVLARLVAVQRPQIASLKALGYANREVALHYLGFALIITVFALVMGVAFGAWLGSKLNILYAQYFRFPEFGYALDRRSVILALLVGLTAASSGAISAVRKAVLLPPAEAMRPEPPPRFRRGRWDRWLAGAGIVSPGQRMVLRNLSRRPGRFAVSVIGVALALALLIVGSFLVDAISRLVTTQFEQAQRYDVLVSLVQPRPHRAFEELRRMPGVVGAEATRSLPATLRFGSRSRRMAILGIEPESHLYRLIGADGEQVELPDEGMVLSAELARWLGCRPGDRVGVELLTGTRRKTDLLVAAVLEDSLGLSATARIGIVRGMAREGAILDGAFLEVDRKAEGELFRRLKAAPLVGGVTLTRTVLESFRQTLAENLLLMVSFNIGFSLIITFGVVYNSARISLAERQRDLASLRVLGFTRREISSILLGEIGVTVAVAIPVGLAVGYGLAQLTVQAMGNELFRLAVVLEPRTIGFAVLTVCGAAVFSALVVRRRLDRLDLVAVLKSRE